MSGMVRKLSNVQSFIYTVALLLAGRFFAELISAEYESVAPIWPPSAVSLAAVLLFGYRIWPALATGFILSTVIFSEIKYFGYAFFPWSLSANIFSPLIAIALLKRFRPTHLLSTNIATIFMLFGAGVVQSVIGAFLGTTGLCISGMSTWDFYGLKWFQWWLSDMFGIVVCTPAIVYATLAYIHREERRSVVAFAEAWEKWTWFFGLLFSCLALSLLSSGKSDQSYALTLTFVPLPFMIWSALRFPPLYTTGAVMAVSLMLVTYWGLGLAGFTKPETVWDFTVLLIFFGMLSLMPQIVALSTYERQSYARKLAWRANHDRLTGLYNRTGFEDEVSQILSSEKHYGEEMALCYLDLDQFKVVNDTCAHAVGDHLIQQISVVLKQNTQDNDFLSRLGGDEFGILFRNCNESDARSRANQLRRLVDEYRFVWNKRFFSFTVSIGVVPFFSGHNSFDQLLSEADAACYTAKEMGRNRVILRTREGKHVSRSQNQMEWAVRISDALEHNHFQLYCQSIAPVGGSPFENLHFEILLRLVNASNEILLPGAFIPAAERFDLMSKVDRWVVNQTLEWLSDHPRQLEKVSLCSINLSGASLGDQEFHGFLQAIMKRNRVPAEKICFEITETAAIGDLDHAASLIKSMKQLGCRFALDDFGSGLASFSYLKSLQVDYLKIDGAFVRDMVDTPVDLAMVKSINEVGHVMGKKTIAEFVENSAIEDKLKELGVDYAQGLAINKPLPIASFFRVMEAGRKKMH